MEKLKGGVGYEDEVEKYIIMPYKPIREQETVS